MWAMPFLSPGLVPWQSADSTSVWKMPSLHRWTSYLDSSAALLLLCPEWTVQQLAGWSNWLCAPRNSTINLHVDSGFHSHININYFTQSGIPVYVYSDSSKHSEFSQYIRCYRKLALLRCYSVYTSWEALSCVRRLKQKQMSNRIIVIPIHTAQPITDKQGKETTSHQRAKVHTKS